MPSTFLLAFSISLSANLPRPAWGSYFCRSLPLPWCLPLAAWPSVKSRSQPLAQASSPTRSLAQVPLLFPPHHSCRG